MTPRVVTFGETMALMHSTNVGSLAHASQVEVGVGGAESNVAIGLSRLGINSTWISRVGNDELGRRVVREIQAEGVDVVKQIDARRPTGLMVKSHPMAGATAVAYYRAGSAASALTPQDLPECVIENADLLHITGITPVLSGSAHQTVLSAIERAQATGTTVSFDINHRSALASRSKAAPIIANIARQADIVFGGPEELALIFEAQQPYSLPTNEEEELALLQRIADLGVKEVVNKRGSEGAWTLVGGTLHKAAGYSVSVIDTVGAGDAFVAGYLSGYLQEMDPLERLQQANACGAFLCMSPGDWEGAPYLSDLKSLTNPAGDPVSR